MIYPCHFYVRSLFAARTFERRRLREKHLVKQYSIHIIENSLIVEFEEKLRKCI